MSDLIRGQGGKTDIVVHRGMNQLSVELIQVSSELIRVILVCVRIDSSELPIRLVWVGMSELNDFKTDILGRNLLQNNIEVGFVMNMS